MVKLINNIEIEKNILGCIIKNNSLFNDVFLNEDMFTNSAYKFIYGIIKKFISEGKVISLIDLYNYENIKNVLYDITSLSYEETFDIMYKELLRLWKLRKLINISREINNLNLKSDPFEIISEIEKSISELNYNKDDIILIRDIGIDVINDIEKKYNSKDKLSGVPSGFNELDEITNGFQKQEYVIIGARPSVGKTSLALSFIFNMLNKNYSVGFFSLEMPKDAILKRMISIGGNVSLGRIRTGYLADSDFKNMTEYMEKSYNDKFYIVDTPNISLSNILSCSKKMVLDNKVDIILIDYMGLIRHDNKLQRWERFNEISMELKTMARRLNIPVIVLSQISRDKEGKRPSMADIRDSGAIEQDADIIILLSKITEDENLNPQEILLHLAKGRNCGTGSFSIFFDKNRTKFFEKKILTS